MHYPGFLFNLKKTIKKFQSEKSEWHHRGVIAGYQTTYSTTKKFSLDLLTVKVRTCISQPLKSILQGAGHMVPTDRPGPALQMIDAFLKKKAYDTPVPYTTDRRPLLPQFTVKYPKILKKQKE